MERCQSENGFGRHLGAFFTTAALREKLQYKKLNIFCEGRSPCYAREIFATLKRSGPCSVGKTKLEAPSVEPTTPKPIRLTSRILKAYTTSKTAGVPLFFSLFHPCG